MICSVVLKYTNGHREEIGSPLGDLRSATKAALDLADYLGRERFEDSGGAAAWVEVYCDADLALSIQVLRGGLRLPETG